MTQDADGSLDVKSQHQFNELRRELLDDKASVINWWLAVAAVVLVLIGYLGFSRFQSEFAKLETKISSDFQKLETEIRNDFEKMKETVDEDVQEIQQKAALVRSITSEDADNPGETERVEEAVLEVRQNPTSSPLDLAITNAFILQRVGKIDAAIEKWRSVANVAEGIDNQLAARAWFSVGYLFQEGDNKGDETEDAQQRSLSAYNEAIRLRPDYPEAYNNRGNVKQAQGQLDEAIADYNEAIRLRPDFPEAYYNRGNVKQAQGQLDEAIADYNEAIRLRPDYPEAYNNRGNVKQAQGQLDEAIADYNEAIRLRPDYPEAYNNRGNVKQAQGQLDEAIADYNEAIRLRPDYPEAYNNRGHEAGAGPTRRGYCRLQRGDPPAAGLP